MMGHMPAIPASTRSSITLRLLDHAEKHWPQLDKVQVTCRGAFAYVAGVLPGGEQIPLFRHRYGGSAHSFRLRHLLRRPRTLRRRRPAHRPPRRKPARSPRHRLHGPPRRPRAPTRTLKPPTNLRGYPLRAAEAQPPQPGGGFGELRVRGARPDLGGAAVAPGVAAEEAHFTADPAQPHQRLADPRVIDMPLAVDEEVVLAEPVAGRPRLDRGQVDAAHREFGEDLEQGTWVVLDQERGQRRPVRPRARGQRPGR